MKKMICFDLDGTLWDTASSTYQCVNEYLLQNHYSFQVSFDTISSNMGNAMDVCARSYFPLLPIDQAKELLQKTFQYQNQLLKEGKSRGDVYPGVASTLKELSKQYILCIVSNCTGDAYIQNFMRAAGVEELITDYIPASKFSITKGEALLRLKKKYSVDSVIYVGDTIKDLEATKEADCIFLYAAYGFGKDLSSTYVVHHVPELLDVIPNISW